jgi:Methylase involved in ubiquinone/menaquinone biosynthesis
MRSSDSRHGALPLTRAGLEAWSGSPRGRRLLAIEEREVRSVLPDFFGRHLLQIGSWGRGQRLLRGAEMLHSAVLGTVPGFGARGVVEAERLPILGKSVDAVLLPHTLEYSSSPHDLLREVSRVLTDRGRLVVLGFNPWSLWSLRGRVGLWPRALPPGGSHLTIGRLSDWLHLLEFEVVRIRRFGTRLPRGTEGGRAAGWSLAGPLLTPWLEGYMLVAKKQVIPMTRMGNPMRAQIVRPLLGRGAAVGMSGNAHSEQQQ